jgi:hypothetical protein
MTAPPWHPRYVITPAIARGLMEIEAARAVVAETPLPLAAEAKAPPPGPPALNPPLDPNRGKPAGGGGPLEAWAVLRVIGNLSAICRRFIGNA